MSWFRREENLNQRSGNFLTSREEDYTNPCVQVHELLAQIEKTQGSETASVVRESIAQALEDHGYDQSARIVSTMIFS